MWLDVTLGGLILLAAFRGWIQGFVSQALRLAEIIACVYLAQPVRDYAKPYVLPYLPEIPLDFVDRVLWWVAAVVSYVVLVAVASLVIHITRRPQIPGIAQAGHNDQFAGFALGATKGLLVAACVTAGVQKYAMERVKSVPWAQQQVKTSWAFKWSETYRPVPRIWASPPVRHLVNRIVNMGLRKPGEPSQSPAGAEYDDESPPVRTASRSADSHVASDARPAAEPPASAAAAAR